MIKSLAKNDCFKNFDLELKHLSHAYLLHSKDRLLNDEVAKLFAMKIFCDDKRPCFECDACKKMMLDKNPDFVEVDKSAINVEDISKIIEDAWLKPMSFDYKVVLIKNADTINELAQNKLLKTLEEPSSSLVFIFTTTNEEKLLPTIKSRVKKIYLNFNFDTTLKQELASMGVNERFLQSDFTLTEMVENSQNEEYLNYLNCLDDVLINLNSTQDIPKSIAKLKISNQNKMIYLKLIEKLFGGNINIFSERLQSKMASECSTELKVKIKSLIEKAYQRLRSNVNANYVFDVLLYEILREKYLSNK